MENVNEYLSSLVTDKVPGHWEFHYGNDHFNLKKFLGSIRRTIMLQPILGSFYKWETFRYDEYVYYAIPEKDYFYDKSKEFLINYNTHNE